jgi:catechol 2,3-dioxygenase-like lactoylglutathione lyase family enzyme
MNSRRFIAGHTPMLPVERTRFRGRGPSALLSASGHISGGNIVRPEVRRGQKQLFTLRAPDGMRWTSARDKGNLALIAASQLRGIARYPGQPGKEGAMFSHVMIGTNDVEKAKAFYDKVLGVLGIAPGHIDRHTDGRLRVRYPSPSGVFAVTLPIDGEPIPANGGTIGFSASSPEQVKAWHDAGVVAGGRSIENPPGVREAAAGRLYIAYLRDLDGNKICALHRMG